MAKRVQRGAYRWATQLPLLRSKNWEFLPRTSPPSMCVWSMLTPPRFGSHPGTTHSFRWFLTVRTVDSVLWLAWARQTEVARPSALVVQICPWPLGLC